MPIDTTHSQYDKKLKTWQKCRDAIAGEEAIKEAKQKYLPKLSGQDEKEYEGYLMRGYYFNASGRTHEAMVGTATRTDPTVEPEYPDKRLNQLAEALIGEVLVVGRAGILVDAPAAGGEPYMAMYVTEDITNWQTVRNGDREILTRVVLRESITTPDRDDPYTSETTVAYRELYLDDNGQYVVQMWEQDANKNFAKAGGPIYPQAAGNPMYQIPFVFVSSNGTKAAVIDPPMLDLINVNLSHYRSAADLEHGRHFTALPTAWVAGFDTEKQLVIGAATAWVTDNVNAKAGFLEFTGAGLGALERALEQKEAQMALLGTQLFMNGVAETATAAKIHRAQQTASLTSVVQSVSEAMTIAYQYLLEMLRSSETAVFDMSTDFMPETIDAGMISTLVSTYQQGGMSIETLLWNFKQGELLPPDITPEDEFQLIQAGISRMTASMNEGGENGMV